MYKIGVIGDRDSVMGFMALGFTVFEATDSQQALEMLKSAATANFAILFITQNYAKSLNSEIQKYSGKVLPAIIPIPDSRASDASYGRSVIKHAVERAVGSDIIFRD